MSEKRLWDTLKEGIGHAGHFDRIESHATSNGHPDVSYCIDGRVGTIELKIYDRKRGGLILRAAQNAWHCTRNRAGCTHNFILARYDDNFGNSEFMLIEGKNSKELIHNRSYEVWRAQAKITWVNRMNFSELKSALKGIGPMDQSPN